MNRPGPVTSNAPDDKPKRELTRFVFGPNNWIELWVDDTVSEIDEGGLIFPYMKSTGDACGVVNTNHLLYAYPR